MIKNMINNFSLRMELLTMIYFSLMDQHLQIVSYKILWTSVIDTSVNPIQELSLFTAKQDLAVLEHSLVYGQ